MAESIPNTQTPICFLLDRVPVEIRLNIYKYAFAGSRVQAALTKTTESSSPEHTGGLVMQYSKHFGLLLTCRAIYYEALDTYWSHTVLELQSPPLVFSSLRAFDHIKLKIDTYSHCLCTSLPEAARANVRHVRGMVLPATRSLWLKKNPEHTAPALLGTFKKLVTCEMTATLAHPIDGLLSHYEDLGDGNFSRFRTTWGAKPSKFLDDRYGITNVGGIAFFLQGKVKYSVRINGQGVEMLQAPKKIRVSWRNHLLA